MLKRKLLTYIPMIAIYIALLIWSGSVWNRLAVAKEMMLYTGSSFLVDTGSNLVIFASLIWIVVLELAFFSKKALAWKTVIILVLLTLLFVAVSIYILLSAEKVFSDLGMATIVRFNF